MMTKAEARQLGRAIIKDGSCHVTGLRRYARGQWEVDCVDRVTGYALIIGSVGAWESLSEEVAWRPD